MQSPKANIAYLYCFRTQHNSHSNYLLWLTSRAYTNSSKRPWQHLQPQRTFPLFVRRMQLLDIIYFPWTELFNPFPSLVIIYRHVVGYSSCLIQQCKFSTACIWVCTPILLLFDLQRQVCFIFKQKVYVFLSQVQGKLIFQRQKRNFQVQKSNSSHLDKGFVQLSSLYCKPHNPLRTFVKYIGINKQMCCV